MLKDTIKAIIVEDDPQHAASLLSLLPEITRPVEVLATCSNVSDAFAKIDSLKPELVFLDIDLEGAENGFDLLKKFDKPFFSVIFTTQHSSSHNAINAIRACALDFLPKPLLKSELEDAINRLEKKEGVEQAQVLKQHIEANGPDKEIIIKSTDGITKIETGNICYAKSDNVYTTFYLYNPVNKKLSHTSSMSIKSWKACLDGTDILRVHNQYLVNLKYAEKITGRGAGGAAIYLKNSTEIPVSESHKKEVMERFKLYRKPR